MSIRKKLRSQKGLPLGFLLLTLIVGILIGTLINTDVAADRSKAAPDATPLKVPSPVKLQNEFSRLAEHIGPAVVNITTEYDPAPAASKSGKGGEEMELFRRFFGERSPHPSPRRATGSGFVVDPKGYIITNYHVVEDADAIKVKLTEDPITHKAKLIGFDTETDLAVIKVDVGHNLPAVEIGNSDATQVGDWAIAIGSPFGLESTVTAGIVSAKGRDIGTLQFQRFIQTDAAINRGNSGGPLVNIRGQVIGVNTMIATSNGGYQGVGFALPINTAAKVYNMIIKSGRVTRGSIGVSFSRDTNPNLLPALGLDHGVVINEVQSGGPAEKAGLQPDDIIVAMNGQPVKNGDDLVARVADTPVGDEVKITADRSGEKLDFDVAIADRSKVWSDQPQFAYLREKETEQPAEESEVKFGIYVRNISEKEFQEMNIKAGGGIMITRVDPGSFADELGLRENDVVISINRQPVKSVEDIKRIQATLESGSPVAIRVARPLPAAPGKDVVWRPFYVAGELP